MFGALARLFTAFHVCVYCFMCMFARVFIDELSGCVAPIRTWCAYVLSHYRQVHTPIPLGQGQGEGENMSLALSILPD